MKSLRLLNASVVLELLAYLFSLVAQIFFSMYLFVRVYVDYERVKRSHTFGLLLLEFVLNLTLYWTSIKGLKKTVAKWQRLMSTTSSTSNGQASYFV
ncbi:uncharacterized protein LOC119983041 isoform X2 [Tripterygium wilfordii]|nr:uncharacterized protein LOC119983041 isoform X2 [Tripterygium wilfordii]XP_038682626.1 uncharacterized protein LOC119983041 isoform X2 [Tripterygium wilfordii]